jgi:hypothetical protein
MISILKDESLLTTDLVTSRLLQELNEFTQGAALSDDVTILVVDYDDSAEK